MSAVSDEYEDSNWKKQNVYNELCDGQSRGSVEGSHAGDDKYRMSFSSGEYRESEGD